MRKRRSNEQCCCSWGGCVVVLGGVKGNRRGLSLCFPNKGETKCETWPQSLFSLVVVVVGVRECEFSGLPSTYMCSIAGSIRLLLTLSPSTPSYRQELDTRCCNFTPQKQQPEDWSISRNVPWRTQNSRVPPFAAPGRILVDW